MITDKGLAIAQMAAGSGYINGKTKKCRYWRTYTSDLYRAHRTAKIVLGVEDVNGNTKDDGEQQQQKTSDEGANDTAFNTKNSINLIVDPRLRELAKGPREGYLKTLSFEEAMSRRLQAAIEDNRYHMEQKLAVPKLESINDAWRRATDWIDSLVKDASDEYHSANKSTYENDETEKVYNVFALSHSALIRTMIHKMVDPQLPEAYAKTNEGSLLLPNLSRTIIDVRPYYFKQKRSGSSESNDDGDDANNHEDMTLRWKCRLLHLADVSHLSYDASIIRKGAPYL